MLSKRRIILLVSLLITFVIGISSRKFPVYFSNFLAEYLGDTLWAMLVFWILGFVFPKNLSFKNAIIALIFSYLIEISQLYQAEWINEIRNTTIGALVLGHGFLWSDIICYTVGIGIGLIVDITLIKRLES